MHPAYLSNDESWQISVNELDLKSDGRYIACALVERVRGFGTRQEGSNILKSTFPVIKGNKIVTTEIELVGLNEIRVPCHQVDHAWFMKQHQDTNVVANAWLVDTMKTLQSLSVLRRMGLYEVATVIYTDPATQMQVTITSNLLVGKTHAQDKGFMFKRIVKE